MDSAVSMRGPYPFSTFSLRSSRSPLLQTSCFAPLKHRLKLSPSLHRKSSIFSLSKGKEEGRIPGGISQVHSQGSQNKHLQVVLVSPQIAGNTGCTARTCAASAAGLHLVGPLGFHIDDAKLKRAGLDYWPYVVVKVHNTWTDFQDYFRQQYLPTHYNDFVTQEGEKRLLAFTKRGTAIHSDFSYRRGDYLIFGSETSGLPSEALEDCKSGVFGGGTIRIPMVETHVRCLNLSVSVGIALYEASRQLKYEQLQVSPQSFVSTEQSFISEDIFA